MFTVWLQRSPEIGFKVSFEGSFEGERNLYLFRVRLSFQDNVPGLLQKSFNDTFKNKVTTHFQSYIRNIRLISVNAQCPWTPTLHFEGPNLIKQYLFFGRQIFFKMSFLVSISIFRHLQVRGYRRFTSKCQFSMKARSIETPIHIWK